MNYRICIALLALATAGSTLAHDELPTIHSCSGKKPIHIGTFDYTKRGVGDYKVCLKREEKNPWLLGGSGVGSPPVCRVEGTTVTMVPCPAQTCGEFDDDYRAARALALAACTGYIGEGTEYPAGGEVIPLFNGPESFLDGSHHEAYSITDGVFGDCALCPDEVQ